MALLRVEFIEGWHVTEMDEELRTPQVLYLAHQPQRVRAREEQLRMRLEAHTVGPPGTFDLTGRRHLIGRGRGRVVITRQQGPESLREVGGHGDVDGEAFRGTLQKVGDMVTRLQRKIEQFRRQLHLTIANLVEDTLHIMGEGRDVVEAEHRPRPLDRVHGPENAVDERPVFGTFLDFKQRRLKFGQQVLRLFDERLTVEFILHDHSPVVLCCRL